MTFLRKCFPLIISIPVFSGCASIVSKSSWPFTVDSFPSGAQVSIANKAGREVYHGRTPATMKLKSGSGFFGKESYTISYQKDGYETKKVTVECKLNGWYFGNLLFGGLLGLLIVDPATGAMYKLEGEGISEKLTKATVTGQATPSLSIIDKGKLTEEQQKHLVRIN